MSVRNTKTLVCDDVRIENTGKFLVIGLYTGPIGIPQIPFQMALTFMHFFEGDRPGHLSLKLRVEHLETGQRLVEGAAQMQVNVPNVPIVAPIKVPLQIDREGAYNLVVEVEGEREPFITPFSIQINRQQAAGFPGGAPGFPGMPRMPIL